MTKAYRAIVKVKNNHLWSAIARAFPQVRSQAGAARVLRVSSQWIGAALNMKRVPQDKQGNWSLTAVRVAKRLRDTPEYLFDPELYGRKPRTIHLEFDRPALTAAGLLALPEPPPDLVAEQGEAYAAIHDALATLKPREAEVLRLRFGLDGEPEQTLAEIGERLGVSRNGIMQIEHRAIRKLRRRCRRLRAVFAPKEGSLTP